MNTITSPATGIHPFFTSPLRWTPRLADALSAAAERDRAVLIVHGAADCAGTRSMVERVLSKEEVSEMVNARFICVVSTPETLEPSVSALIAQVSRQTPTPLCLYVDGHGKLLHATAGGRPAAVLINDMLESLSKQKRA